MTHIDLANGERIHVKEHLVEIGAHAGLFQLLHDKDGNRIVINLACVVMAFEDEREVDE